VQTALQEFIMCLQAHALRYCKVTKTKLVKFSSTLRAIKSSQLHLTRLVRSGRATQAMSCRLWTDTKTKSFRARLTTKEIQLLQDLRITRAAFGKTRLSCRRGTNRTDMFMSRKKTEIED